MFAIFILTAAGWVQHGDLLSDRPADRTFADAEIAYLENSLGVTARLFRKV
jgi:hypothetical protein